MIYVKFRLVAQLAKKGDSITDPTSVWPDERSQIDLGEVTLTGPVANVSQVQKTTMFNPLALPDATALVLPRPPCCWRAPVPMPSATDND